jgi:hypothetical protein
MMWQTSRHAVKTLEIKSPHNEIIISLHRQSKPQNGQFTSGGAGPMNMSVAVGKVADGFVGEIDWSRDGMPDGTFEGAANELPDGTMEGT